MMTYWVTLMTKPSVAHDDYFLPPLNTFEAHPFAFPLTGVNDGEDGDEAEAAADEAAQLHLRNRGHRLQREEDA